MLICLHELISDIQYRYLHHWHPAVLYESYPNVKQAAGQIELLDHKLKILLSHAFTLSADKPKELISFKQFLTLIKECIIDEWPASPPLHPLSNAWYWHDRFTMYGVHYLMMQIILHNQTELELSDCPPLIVLADIQSFVTDIQTIKEQLSQDDFVWLKKMEQQFSTLPWQVERQRLMEKSNSLHISLHRNDIMHQCIEMLLQTKPASRHDELVLTSLMVIVRSKLETAISSSSAMMVIRDMILTVVKASGNWQEWIAKLMQTYLNYWEQKESVTLLKQEQRFWQHLNCQYPDNWMLRYIDTHLNDILTSYLESATISKPMLYWSASVQDFIRCFHPLIARGKIQHRGNSDMVPIVTILHQLFEIPKSRGVGLVSCPSLLTYFKNGSSNAN